MSDFDYVRAHGLGNDYLVIDSTRLPWPLTPARIRAICDRHKGVGSDGILLRVDQPGSDFGVRILNPDGSEAEKSGNGLRIFAKFLHDHGYTTQTEFRVHTPGGVVRAKLITQGARVTGVRVDMGRATIDRELTRLEVDGQNLSVVTLSVGNPHCVIIVTDLAAVNLFQLGPAIETHSAFPNRTNVQFAQVQGRHDIRALIWERGAGHTLASGSSSCAVAVACCDRGLVDSPVTVHMEGGDLEIGLDRELNLVMTGPAEEVGTGVFSAEFRERLAGM